MTKLPEQPSSGVEIDRPADVPRPSVEEAVRSISISSQHLRLTQVLLADGTDRCNELVHERQWLLHPSQRDLRLQGNLFLVEDLAAGRGRILIKEEPLPEARPQAADSDLQVTPRKAGGFDIALLATPGRTADSWTVLDYEGDALARTDVLHQWQQGRRPATASHRCPRFVSNTWGDRSRDSRVTETFLLAEIEAAARLGVDVVQIDDGWQRGTTANSAWAAERGGVWQGFWHADEHFWEPHPQRFPRGLEPLVAAARRRGLGLGLWLAPDSWNDFANWQRDAGQIIQLHRRLGVEHFKIDGVKAPTWAALENLQRFFRQVLQESGGRVAFDLDITAGVRPGYFGAMEVGPLFVENRYTDWHNYWPHQTLRNLCKLSRWIDPRRLRMELLNNTRNADNYAGDPLAPAAWQADALFASVMFGNPLGWFEVSSLPADYVSRVAPLVNIWREHRQALFGGVIVPIGQEPDGFGATGLLSLGRDGQSGYAVVFRGLHAGPQLSLALPRSLPQDCRWQRLGGQGSLSGQGQRLEARIDEPLGFVFGMF